MILLNFCMVLLPCKNRSSKRLTPQAAGEAWWPIMNLSGWSFQGLHEKTPVSQGVCGLCDGVWRIVQGQARSTCSIKAYLNEKGWSRHAFSPCVASELLRCLCYQKYIRKTIVFFNTVRIFWPSVWSVTNPTEVRWPHFLSWMLYCDPSSCPPRRPPPPSLPLCSLQPLLLRAFVCLSKCPSKMTQAGSTVSQRHDCESVWVNSNSLSDARTAGTRAALTRQRDCKTAPARAHPG